MDKAVSVLVVTRDRRQMLDALLEDLRAQDYPAEVQIVVVEETEDPRPPKDVVYVPHPVRNLGIAHARNVALEHASHEVLVFVDDDCRVAPDWLDRLLAPLLGDEAVLGVQGGVTVPEGTNAIGWTETLLGFPGGGLARIHASGGRIQETIEVSTLNAAYRKRAVLDAGGFDEAARLGGEDYLLAKRVAQKGKLLFVPDAVVKHKARGSLAAIWCWFMRRGMAETELVRAGLAPRGYPAFMLRSSLLFKLGLLFLAVPWLGWWMPALLPAAVAAVTWRRAAWTLKRSEIPVAAWILSPAIRLFMDASTDMGRIKAMVKRR